MKKLLLSVSILALVSLQTKAQLFSQNFDGSSDVATYFNATNPNSGQFTNISAAGTSTVTAPSGKLRLNKVASGNNVNVYRNFDFSTQPTFVQLKFDVEVSGATANANHLTVFIGSGFSTTNTANTSNFTTRFTINATSANEFRVNVQDVASNVYPSTTTSFTGQQTITFVVNKSGATRTYTAPDNSSQSIATETMDVWVGTNNFGNDLPLPTTQGTVRDITGFKLQQNISASAGTTEFDNIVFTDLLGNSVLPIELKSFSGKEDNKSIVLNWATASESNNKNFEVLRSSDGKSFKSIGSVDGAINSNEEVKYSFVDANPLGGVNYYKLKQNDLDGKSSYSEVIAVNSKLEETKLAVYATNSINVSITSPNKTNGKLSLFDTTGRLIETKNVSLENGFNTVILNQNLNKGIYFVTLESEGQVYTQKFMN
jgi:hypothetical protein